MERLREEAITLYHELLASDHSLTPELFARLRSMMAAAHLLYGERPVGISLRPHLLTRAQYDLLVRASETVAGALGKVADRMIADPALMETVGVEERVRRLALADPGYSHPGVSARLDAFINGQEIKFVEYNGENPSSLNDQMGLNQVLFEVKALERLAERYRLRQFNPAGALLRSLLETFCEWGGRGAPNVAILDWPNVATRHEFLLLRNLFVGSNVPAIVCGPEELEYTKGRLRRGDFSIDLVYKRVVIHEFLAKYDDSHPLLQAYLNGHVCLVNSFRCKVIHKKAVFELLTDEERRGWFTPAEREVIRACVPWTRRVRARKTFFKGAEVDLLEHVRQNRAGFLLKPNDDYGGRGIGFGREMSQGDWDAWLERALKEDYVVQEVIELRTEKFPIFDERGWTLQPMYVDTNPFLFRGKVEGVMVRLSDAPVVNVTSGGGETGFFVIEGEVGEVSQRTAT